MNVGCKSRTVSFDRENTEKDVLRYTLNVMIISFLNFLLTIHSVNSVFGLSVKKDIVPETWIFSDT